MIDIVNQNEFVDELNRAICSADWHKRYYAKRAHKYHWIAFWIRLILGVVALLGAGLATAPKYRLIGALIASGCAGLTASISPLTRWESIVSGIKKEEEEWPPEATKQPN
jgi:hypothetical protein